MAVGFNDDVKDKFIAAGITCLSQLAFMSSYSPSTSWSIKRMAAILLVLTWPRHFMALVLTTLRRNMQLKNRRHYMHVDGRQKTVFTVLREALPDVRDAPLDDYNAAASSTNAKPRWLNWNEDYAVGYQRHP